MLYLRICICITLAWLGMRSPVAAQEGPVAPAAAPTADLSTTQQQLYRDYERFEKALFDVAEQARRKDPERAELLYHARSRSQEVNILAEMETVTELLRAQDTSGTKTSPQFGPAVDRQKELVARLEAVLNLLQNLDERDRIAAEIERIQELLKDTNRLIARQKDVRAQTQRSQQGSQARGAQQKVADEAEKLTDKIEAQDRERQQQEDRSEKQDAPSSEKSDSQESGPEGEKSGEKSGKSGKKSSPGEKSPSGEQSPKGEQPEGQKPASPSKPQQGPPPQGGAPQQPSSQENQEGQKTPGREELEQARREMQQAIEQLEQDNRDKALDEQDDAVARLEEMKAQLEEILRQLREDERESYLTLLEARFQNLLKRQQQINSETIRLNSIPEGDRPQQNYASQTDTIRKEQDDNAREAEKTLHLLKEEGSSVAFPEAVEQMHRNMRVVVGRLLQQDTGKTTQLVEQLIVETLEEMIAALRQEMQKKQEEQPGQPGQQGEPQDPGLVNKIAELKLIRSLQSQVNRLTLQIGTELEGQIPTDPAHVELIQDLRTRQERIQRATYDLSVGRNE